MPSRIKMEPRSATALSRTSSMDQNSHARHSTNLRETSSLTTGIAKVEDISSQGGFPFSSSVQGASRTHDLDHWSLNTSDSLASSPITFIHSETAETPLLSYSLPHSHYLPSSIGESTSIFSTLADIHPVRIPGDANESDYSQDFPLESMVEFVYDDDSCTSDSTHGRVHDDISSLDQNSSPEDRRLVAAPEAWSSINIESSSLSGSAFESLSTNAFPDSVPAPASPPLTDGSLPSVNSARPQFTYSFQGQEETLNSEKANNSNWTTNSHNFGDPGFPLTPPLNGQDPNRTIRASKQTQRSLVPMSNGRSPRKSDPEVYISLPLRETLRQRPKENSEIRSPRDHPYYSLPTQSDGKYYCPFSSGDKPCSHPPTTQKCAYHKYLDSHLKPYRCKVAVCMDAQLHFSSNACLFRHEREAHGFHGHGDNPHLCLFDGCDRAIPGNGFPRRWNLFDHMKRVHDYTASESSNSSEDVSTTAASQTNPKKETGRKRKISRPISGSQTMKRSRSTQSSPATTVKSAISPIQSGQKLRIAERNYYNCRARLLAELSNITPQDPEMHDKANASLQELFTLGLNYRRIEAASAAVQVPNSVAD